MGVEGVAIFRRCTDGVAVAGRSWSNGCKSFPTGTKKQKTATEYRFAQFHVRNLGREHKFVRFERKHGNSFLGAHEEGRPLDENSALLLPEITCFAV